MAERHVIQVVVPAGRLGISVKCDDAGQLIVTRVTHDSPCRNLLQVRDIIMFVDGESVKNVRTPQEFNNEFLLPKSNDVKNFTIVRFLPVEDNPEQDENEGYQMRPRHEKQLESTTQSQRETRKRNECVRGAEEVARETQTKKKQKKKRVEHPRFINHDPKHAGKVLCDICNQPDGHFRKNMQICCECGVAVHEECYGLRNSLEGKKYPDWKCHACAIIDRKIYLKAPNGTMEVTHSQRPQKCALCQISDGNHAMHPLYNKHGKDGVPLLTKTPHGPGIRMVHTLCALTINQNKYSRNIVYGCDVKGDQHFQKWCNHDNKVSLDMSYRDKSGKKILLKALVNHFVIAHDDKTLPPKEYAECKQKVKEKKEFQTLCCTVCNKKNKSRQIPIQCAAGCGEAVHVGCARWGMGGIDGVRFFPGTEKYPDADLHGYPPIGRVYCKEHAQRQETIERRKFE